MESQIVYTCGAVVEPWFHRALAAVTAMRFRRASTAEIPCVQTKRATTLNYRQQFSIVFAYPRRNLGPDGLARSDDVGRVGGFGRVCPEVVRSTCRRQKGEGTH